MFRSLFISSLLLCGTSVFAQSAFKLTDTSYTVGQQFVIQQLNYSFCFGFHMEEESGLLLDSIANWMKAHPAVHTELGIHCDSRGDAATNLRITGEKAAFIRDLLIERGVNPEQLSAKGYGEEQLVIPESEMNAFKSNRKQYELLQQRNRRQILSITKI